MSEIKEELNSECVFNFFTSSSLRHLRQSLQGRVILDRKCAQAGKERHRSGLVENTVPFDIRKFRRFKPEFLVERDAPYIYSEKEETEKIRHRKVTTESDIFNHNS